MGRTEIAFRILGKRWTLTRITKKSVYYKRFGRDSHAVTRTDKRKIYLSPSGKDLETITHELVHAYIYELCLYSAELDRDSFEEIICEMFAKFGQEIIQLAQKIYKIR